MRPLRFLFKPGCALLVLILVVAAAALLFLVGELRNESRESVRWSAEAENRDSWDDPRRSSFDRKERRLASDRRADPWSMSGGEGGGEPGPQGAEDVEPADMEEPDSKEAPDKGGPDQGEGSSGAARELPEHERLFLIKPRDYVHAGAYGVPGYYTLILFSASWCAPCGKVREHAPEWLDRYPNLVIVDLDIGSEDGVSSKAASILEDLEGEGTMLPSALLLNPFGLYANRSTGNGQAPPVSGYDEIVERFTKALPMRKHSEVIPMRGAKTLRSLRSLHSEKDHYSLAGKV